MKIIKRDGCLAFDLTVDGKSVSDMSKEERIVFVDKLLQVIKNGILDNTVSIESLIEIIDYDSYETENNTCDQCGDRVTTTTWNI